MTALMARMARALSAADAGGLPADQVEALLLQCSCTLCKELYTDPVTLPCDETFCRACVMARLAGKGLYLNQCPECRQPCFANELRPNCKMASIKETVMRLMEALDVRRAAPSPRPRRLVCVTASSAPVPPPLRRRRSDARAP